MYIGVDIGGTKIHSIVAEWDKNFLTTRKLPKIVRSNRITIQNKKSESKFFGEIIDEIDSLLKEFELIVPQLSVSVQLLHRHNTMSHSQRCPLSSFAFGLIWYR